MLEAGLDGLVQRGRAQPGEKTMVDAVHSALLAAQAAASRKDDIQTALLAVVEAAGDGVEATIPIIAKKGRASYLGELSAGHQDPGATSIYFILRSLMDVVNTEE
jgi:dihydroxyacetone kinase-like protein